jgi:hypothetical protein
MNENKLHAALLAVFVAFAGWTFADAVERDAARDAAAAQGRSTHVAALAAPSARR